MGNMRNRPVAEMTSQAIENFWSHVDRRGPNECWPWLASCFDSGYGQFKGGPSTRAHRVAYELLVGPIPKGKVLDHLCFNNGCVNPAHLEPVSQGINLSRLGNRNKARREV